jgi:hypothetical protein
MEGIGRERRLRRVFGGALVAIGLVAAALAVWLALQGDVTPSFVGLAITLLTLAGGAVLLVRGATHRARERNTALRALTEARMRLQELKEQSAEREMALSDLTRRLGLATNADLLREHAEYLRMVREGDRFAWVNQDLERLTGDESELRKRCWQWAARVGAEAEGPEPPEGWTIDAALPELREGITKMITLRSQRERLEEQREEKAVAAARQVVSDLGTPAGDWERALEELERRRRSHERHHQITRTLPDLERQVLVPPDRESTEHEIARLEGELERIREDHPNWFSADDTEATGVTEDLTRTVAENRLRQVQVALEESREKRHALEKEIGRLEEETEGGGRASQLRLRVAELENEMERARRFQAAVHLAKERLQSVARETHALWSEFLSHRVNGLLPTLGPGYRGFEVEGQRLDRQHLDQVLSAGTRDQLALALRIAVCEFLSRDGETLPLVFDDPFSTGDDDRAEAGLRFLAETIAPAHQILVLTCHQGRVESLRQQDAAWWDEHVHEIATPISARESVTDPEAVRTLGGEESGLS